MKIDDLLKEVKGSGEFERIGKPTYCYQVNGQMVGVEELLCYLFEKQKKLEKELSATQPDRIKAADEFEVFWATFPKQRRKAKGDAQKAWHAFRRNHIEPDLKTILSALQAQKTAHIGEWTYFPLPATWIRQQRWEDAIDKPTNPNQHCASPVIEDSIEDDIKRLRTWIKEQPAGERTNEKVKEMAQEIWTQLPEDLKKEIDALPVTKK